MTQPKPRGLLSGTTIRDTLIGVLRPLLMTQTPDKAAGPTKAHGLLPIRRKGKDSKEAQRAAQSHPPRTRGTISASLEGPSRARWTISASLEGSGSILERVTHLCLARG